MLNKPIILENESHKVHPFGPDDFKRYKDLVIDIYNILTDDFTLKYIPEKRLVNITAAETFLNSLILNYHSGRNYVHFITNKKSLKVIGIIDLITPETAKEFYDLEEYPYFLEFYMESNATGCYLMTQILPLVVDMLQAHGIRNIGAVVNRKNIAAMKVLEKAKFLFNSKFDLNQDLYLLI